MLLMASEGTWIVGSKKSVESKKIWRNIWWNKPFGAGALQCVHLKIRGHLDAKSSRKNWWRWMLMWKLRASFFQATVLGNWNYYFQGWKRNLHLGDQFRSLGRSWRWSLSCDSFLANVSWSGKKDPLLRSEKLSLIKLKWCIWTRKAWSQAFHIFLSPPQKSNLLRGTFLHPFQKELCLPNNLKSDHFSDCCLGVILPNIWDEININIFLIIMLETYTPWNEDHLKRKRKIFQLLLFRGLASFRRSNMEHKDMEVDGRWSSFSTFGDL